MDVWYTRALVWHDARRITSSERSCCGEWMTMQMQFLQPKSRTLTYIVRVLPGSIVVDEAGPNYAPSVMTKGRWFYHTFTNVYRCDSA